jgi:hypothetical protein
MEGLDGCEQTIDIMVVDGALGMDEEGVRWGSSHVFISMRSLPLCECASRNLLAFTPAENTSPLHIHLHSMIAMGGLLSSVCVLTCSNGSVDAALLSPEMTREPVLTVHTLCNPLLLN